MLAALIWGALPGCGGSDGGSADDDGTTEPPIQLDPGPGGFAMDFATSDDFFTQMEARRLGLPDDSPHRQIQIWYSSNLKPAVSRSTFDAPEGTTAIKVQDRNGSGSPTNILVMTKLADGESPVTNDWCYEVRNATGDFQSGCEQNMDYCHGCHQAWPETSNLVGTKLVD